MTLDFADHCFDFHGRLLKVWPRRKCVVGNRPFRPDVAVAVWMDVQTQMHAMGQRPSIDAARIADGQGPVMFAPEGTEVVDTEGLEGCHRVGAPAPTLFYCLAQRRGSQ